MARTKKNAGRPAPAYLRFGDIEPGSCGEHAEVLERLAAQLREADGKIRARLRVDGITKFERGVERIEQFVRNVRKALIDAEG